jgi:nicotinamidase-related amidase
LVDEVRMSNHASTARSAAAAVAAPSSQGDRRQAATATPSRRSARARSKPAHAMSQWAAAWVDGKLRIRKRIQGTSTIPASENNGTTQRAGRQPPVSERVSR